MARDGDLHSLDDDSDGVSVSVASHDKMQTDPLTRKNLARLNALNGTAEVHNINTAYLFEDGTNNTMEDISTTDSDFEQRAYENGILDPIASRPPPPDLNAIQHRFTQRRTSTQPSKHAHQAYCTGISDSYNEDDVSDLVQANIMKRYDQSDLQYGRARGRAITEIPSQDFNNGLSDARPDILEGLKTRVLPDHLHNNAFHTQNSLSFCHFAAEFKRTKNSNLHQATVQAAYDGAVMVNARNRALVQAAALDKKRSALEQVTAETAVFTCITDGKVAEVFAHRSQGGQYYQNLVARESLLNYPNRGRQLIRNAQDYARGKSYELANLLGAD